MITGVIFALAINSLQPYDFCLMTTRVTLAPP